MKLTALLSLSFIIGTGVFASGCSAAPDEEEDVGTSEGELRTLGSEEIVGEIAFGTSNTEVQHPGETSSRRVYRALKVQANKGDVIDATAIVGNAADPVLYVLDSTFRTLKSNDDDRAGEKTSHVTYKATRNGTYYLAFRTKEGWRTKFYVSLRAKNGTTNPPPPVEPPVTPPPTATTTVDLFAPTTAPDLDNAQVLALFQTGANARELGGYRVVQRKRTCNELTGCGPFTPSITVEGLKGYVNFPGTSWNPGIRVGQWVGGAQLVTTTDGVKLKMGKSTDEVYFEECALAQSTARCHPKTVKSTCSSGGTNCSSNELNVEVLDNQSNILAFDVKLTSAFVYGRSPIYKSKVDAQRQYTEAQYAFVASVSGRPGTTDVKGETMTARFE